VEARFRKITGPSLLGVQFSPVVRSALFETGSVSLFASGVSLTRNDVPVADRVLPRAFDCCAGGIRVAQVGLEGYLLAATVANLTFTIIDIGQFEVSLFCGQETVVLVFLKVKFTVESREVEVLYAI
jgi:hypothetical protein